MLANLIFIALISGVVIFCGGQSHKNPAHRDCLFYHPQNDVWLQFTPMKKNHNEASVANAGKVCSTL